MKETWTVDGRFVLGEMCCYKRGKKPWGKAPQCPYLTPDGGGRLHPKHKKGQECHLRGARITIEAKEEP